MLTNDKLRALQNSPFLINRENLPHFTKLLMQNWDKAALGLTPEQKKKLLKIRNDTLRAIKAIKIKLQPLEEEVAEAMIDGEAPSSVEKQLREIAKLKLEATRVHLKCISDTTSVLSEEQIEMLLPIWE
jgi:propanediol dehydratase large subunit